MRRSVSPDRTRRVGWADLPILLGHWGEVVLFYLDRLDSFAPRARLPLSFSEYARRHVYATAGGLYSERYLNWADQVLGVERLLTSPFVLADARWYVATDVAAFSELRVAVER